MAVRHMNGWAGMDVTYPAVLTCKKGLGSFAVYFRHGDLLFQHPGMELDQLSK